MENDEQAIRRLISTWLAATAAGDNEKVLSLIADDVVFLLPGRSPMRKADFAASQEALGQFEMRATSDIREIEVLGEWAWCWTWLSVVVTPRGGGDPVKRAGYTLSIFQKQAGSLGYYS